MPDFASPVDQALAAVRGDAGALDAYLLALKDRQKTRGAHLGSHLGIEVVDVSPDRVTMRLPWRSELRRGGGIFHGGAVMALADHVAGCVFNTDPRIAAAGATGVTTDFSASFLRAAEAGEGEALVAVGWALRRGRNVTFMQVDVKDEGSGAPVAVCRATYLTIPRAKVVGPKR